MDALWDEYVDDIRPIVEDLYDTTTLAKPSGPLGAVLHIQWHYPTFATKKTNRRFRHVLDPCSPSLSQQAKKIGCSTSVSTSDMIPFRNKAKHPE
ncbi:uncharacterized protein Triagg1_10925 [Trichoderma aggressivum f. europaeum]|uniref:Uncharacterized protein n=1 Tax=Trichoderma aggressivum f. europaeum TaxID=173218 RepID=A0AAE1I889_9HYPO|nr:hypothetical protein Triagg1_10925 [Trichoderma aggressivum f. europaeum]